MGEAPYAYAQAAAASLVVSALVSTAGLVPVAIIDDQAVFMPPLEPGVFE